MQTYRMQIDKRVEAMDCRGPKPLIMLHIPHGAGTFVCSHAIQNAERTCSTSCLCDGGDAAYFV